MKEELLYYVWKYGILESSLITTEGKEIKVFDPGHQNTFSGPDFTQARVLIDGQLWAGNVEIHVRSSDWKKHGHDGDPAYHSLVLHVVFEEDVEIDELTIRNIPTLELKNQLDRKFIDRFQNFGKNSSWISCESQLDKVDSLLWTSWLSRLGVERLERKTEHINHILQSLHGDWERTFLVSLFRCFGFKVNALPMEVLARRIKIRQLQNSSNLEALLIGLAGLLPAKAEDEYSKTLLEVFEYERAKWHLKSLSSAMWKRGGVRPYNQPHFRLAQLASMLEQYKGGLLSSFFEMKTRKDIHSFLEAKPVDYWKTHFSLGKEGSPHSLSLSGSAIDLIIINTVVPFLFTYGRSIQNEEHVLRALRLLEELKPESNSIVSNWEQRGIKAGHAGDSQALLELYNEYCSPKKCLFCNVGNQLLR